MDKAALWEQWKAQGVTPEEGKAFFQEYEKTRDVDTWLACLCGSRFSVPKRIKIMYALRGFDRCNKIKVESK